MPTAISRTILGSCLLPVSSILISLWMPMHLISLRTYEKFEVCWYFYYKSYLLSVSALESKSCWTKNLDSASLGKQNLTVERSVKGSFFPWLQTPPGDWGRHSSSHWCAWCQREKRSLPTQLTAQNWGRGSHLKMKPNSELKELGLTSLTPQSQHEFVRFTYTPYSWVSPSLLFCWLCVLRQVLFLTSLNLRFIIYRMRIIIAPHSFGEIKWDNLYVIYSAPLLNVRNIASWSNNIITV